MSVHGFTPGRSSAREAGRVDFHSVTYAGQALDGYPRARARLTKARARWTVGNRMGRGRTERIGIF